MAFLCGNDIVSSVALRNLHNNKAKAKQRQQQSWPSTVANNIKLGVGHLGDAGPFALFAFFLSQQALRASRRPGQLPSEQANEINQKYSTSSNCLLWHSACFPCRANYFNNGK